MATDGRALSDGDAGGSASLGGGGGGSGEGRSTERRGGVAEGVRLWGCAATMLRALTLARVATGIAAALARAGDAVEVGSDHASKEEEEDEAGSSLDPAMGDTIEVDAPIGTGCADSDTAASGVVGKAGDTRCEAPRGNSSMD